MKYWIALVFVLLSGCSATCIIINRSPVDAELTTPAASSASGIKMGGDAKAPYGYTEMCERQPDLIECGGTK